MNLRQLEYFIKIVDTGSFTQASKYLGIAQPSLGCQVKKLEDELGVELLVRNSRGIEITAPGHVLYESGKRLLADAAAMKQRVSDCVGPARGHVALGLPPSMAAILAIPLINRARTEFPEIAITITEEMSNVLSDLVTSRDLDLALAYGILPTRGLRLKRLGMDRLKFVSAKGKKGTDTASMKFSEIASIPLILPRKPQRLRQLIDEAARERGVDLKVVFEMQSFNTILRLVESGHGATLMAGLAAARLPHEGPLSARDLVGPSITFNLELISSDSSPLSRAAQVVAKLVETLLHEEIFSPGVSRHRQP